ncbi:hypothetical protein DICPUDRAFT_82847 [Dictyostelium purpureum]|uniref:SAP domain-containing protein n=1 Tax=Dictyostelium purpureum TaxID=5786 RepID=F0ZXT5_DICPU|nr:uncharacterized protein DICPUDRAFT_82847 [Dictyostelium purpureum]EGC31253.1 hypothetical protein DICPUDRAFT_82847 [Dictyostelium purpureum]|eukprot:XP_003292231.1 hypothetical protein DICPUDRAFT_82847 [Dictyostelium purpureum]
MNNKRSIEALDDDNNKNKKNKKNHSDDENKPKQIISYFNSDFDKEYNEFIKKDYNKLKREDIKEFANKIGINSIGKKCVIYKRVSEFFGAQQTLAIEKQEKESINSFNKDTAQLKFKDIAPHETLFWAIFRNKVIFKNIFSNFIFSRSFSYERLNSLNFILDRYTNGEAILKDKVKSAQNLQLILNYNYTYEIKTICETIIKDTPSNRSFYQQLFSNYSKTIKIIEFFKMAFQTSNITVLKELNHYLQTRESFSDIDVHYIQTYQSIKMIKYLNSVGFRTRIKRNYYHDNKCFFFRFSFDISSLKNLNQLIKTVECLPLLYEKIENSQMEKIKTLKKLSSKLFTQEQLKSTLNQLLMENNCFNNNNMEIITSLSFLNNNNNHDDMISFFSIKKIILKYIKLFFQIIQQHLPPEYYIFSSDKQLFLEKLRKNKFLYEILFKYTITDYQLYLEASNLLLEEKYCSGSSLFIFLKLTLARNNLELIRVIFDQHIKIFNSFFPLYNIKRDTITILNSIQSTEVLDYFYNNHQSIALFRGEHNYFCFFVSNKTILKHYEELMVKLGRSFFVHNLDFWVNKDFAIGFEVFYRTDKNPIVYNTRDFHTPVINPFCQRLKSEDQVDTTIKYFKSKSYILIYSLDLKIINFYNLKVFQWLLEHAQLPLPNEIIGNQKIQLHINFINNKNQKLQPHQQRDIKFNKQTLLIEVSSVTYISLLYIFGRYETIFQIKNLSLVLFQNFKFSTEFIDQLLNNLLITKTIKIYEIKLCEIIMNLINEGNTAAIKIISLKYPQIITKHSPLNPNGIFKNSKKLLRESIKRDHVEISEILFYYISINNKEFERYIKNSSDRELFDFKLN